MIFELHVAGQVTELDVDALGTSFGGVITIGRKCDEVWNAIAIDDDSVDSFQCHIIGVAGGPWTLRLGQIRTECPKGLRSSKSVPCNGCTGRCVNIRAGRPRYFLRTPQSPVLVNGTTLTDEGFIVETGDAISFGNVSISVK